MKKILPFIVIAILILGGYGVVAIKYNIEKSKAYIYNQTCDGRDYTHTVFVEVGSTTKCPQCPASNSAWHDIYGGGNYNFEYCEMVIDKNTVAYNHMNFDYNIYYVPASYFDGGQFVHPYTDYDAFLNYLDSCGARTVPDLVADLNVYWLGDAKLNIYFNIENNEADDYPGQLRVYVSELESTYWTDASEQPFYHAFLDFVVNQTINIPANDDYSDSVVWDGAVAGYPDITKDNIQVVLAVFDDEPHQGYSDPPDSAPFWAYYVDETVAALVDENSPPEKPTVTGPTDIEPSVEYQYSIVAKDPNGDDLMYYIDWGDITEGWLGPYQSEESIFVPHSWSVNGIYEVKVKARDENNVEGPWSDPLTVVVGNVAPEKPKITGETNGLVGTEYEYTFVSNDPNGDNLYYYIKWGDGNRIEWVGPHASGVEVKFSHTWNRQGSLIIEAKVKDTEDAESDWGRLPINMPRNISINNGVILRIFEKYPQLFQFIKYLLR